jgi:hypothetical protein
LQANPFLLSFLVASFFFPYKPSSFYYARN